ncbi:hypothetical protein GCM10007860_13590 [Chitiniphilus shinanonensis]|uniref:DUF805 domain-containing protein n=1 Tax=Chitiniphilus shinanonensis TaxID=553088 RepID=A0ABQ6BRH4_9NEIS|nr:DUF805 domain-containing protein [Chitiniphilus shinanonensis]GLS04213.1 hypothetical protein GCM10007860_13590 [Chitiniphilus shinanonensis]
MSNTVRLLLTGAILPGHTRESLLHQLGGLLKLERERVAELIDNAPTIIKQQLPVEHLDAYLPLLARTGAVVRVEHLDGRPYQPRRVAAPDAFPTLLLDDAPESAMPATQVQAAPRPAESLAVPARSDEPAAQPEARPAPAVETMNCPACGHGQPRRTLCVACGVDMPRLAAAKAQAEREARAEALASRHDTPRPVVEGVLSADYYETPQAVGLRLDGRLGRMRYLAYALAMLVALLPGVMLASHSLMLVQSVGVPFLVAWAALYGRLTVFRLHDLGMSSWWMAWAAVGPAALLLIDVRVGTFAIMLLALTLLGLAAVPGPENDNEFGPPAEPSTTPINVAAAVCLAMVLLGLPRLLPWDTWVNPEGYFVLEETEESV